MKKQVFIKSNLTWIVNLTNSFLFIIKIIGFAFYQLVVNNNFNIVDLCGPSHASQSSYLLSIERQRF